MKNKIWLFQIPLVVLFTLAFFVSESGIDGNLQNQFLRDKAYPALRVVSGWFTNFKFKARGVVPHKNNVVIVEIDSDALEAHGRWPWHRDLTAKLIQKTFDAGAKVVGLDIVFSEPDTRVSPEIAQLLLDHKLEQNISSFETDYALQQVIQKNRDNLVIGWITDDWCQPAYRSSEDCPVMDPDHVMKHPQNFEKFAYQSFVTPNGFDQTKTALLSTPSFIANIQMYNDAALHSGTFAAFPDDDGYIRRTNMLMTANGRAYPTLPLEMARIGLNEDLRVELGADQKVHEISFMKSGRKIPVSPLGSMEINFRGPSQSFQYIRANEVMGDEDEIHIEKDRAIASASKSALLKDAYVLIGLTAIGVYDMRAFPFDSNTAGVEGHASILDNLLSNDMLIHNSKKGGFAWMYIFMIAGALLFAFVTEKLESIPALALFVGSLVGFGAFDMQVLFKNYINWNTSLFYIEIVAIFAFTMSVKYVMEERNKKFIKGAFAKYVSPAIIESIMKDPSKLSVGGEKRDLTIMFSDIRSFTSFSEKMDAKALAGFLNDYLGTMTDLVFEHEGTLDKYIGDAVMAFWGAPLDQPNHAINACKAAVKMQQSLAKSRPRFKEQYGIDVNIGIGINSGDVNVGNMGSERIFEYTVIGDHVNLASRLEGLTKEYRSGILTTRFTFDEIKKSNVEPPRHRVLDFVKVKGKKKAVELIQVIEKEYPDEGLKIFEEGRILYTEQKWDEATVKFTQANELLKLTDPDDGPSVMYIERCVEFKINPPAADWDGSWEMHSK